MDGEGGGLVQRRGTEACVPCSPVLKILFQISTPNSQGGILNLFVLASLFSAWMKALWTSTSDFDGLRVTPRHHSHLHV